ncbi:uncharacterized protein LTR77_000011 [Saxophila tyrrhenica]|uniref:Zn(2)-C6 fungal-type domain-containing protein n=1 Tax=Saxophila tyrrhenica TaxID=1690608 RepID=A0AAV9PRC2_9PEZI|nr:hypothetical protein LTR77_000011 [Saxophila tyrrhenica]
MASLLSSMHMMADDNSDTSPATSEQTNSTAPRPAPTNGQAHHKQKRARSQLSCTPCRQGKLKCNRVHEPACDQCIKRNRESACVYLPPPVKHKPAQNVKGRIRQLESLVVDLMQNQRAQGQSTATTGPKKPSASKESRETAEENRPRPFSQPTPPSDNDTSPQDSEQSQETHPTPEDVDSATAPFGQMKISKDEISYVGESHWGAILNSISDLKRDIGDGDEEDGVHASPEQTINSWSAVPMGGVQPHSTTGLGFMLGGERPSVSKQELIKAVPEKRVADRLLSLWFNSPDPFKPIIHAPTFQDEYRRFWKSPNETPVMWLGLLHAILSLATSFGLRESDPRSPDARAVLANVNKYHSMSASAALLADFTKPKPYTLECLILYSAGLRSNNAFVNVWLMIGLVVRLALRMGYHRDPSHYRAISVFQGEMRRRVWSVIGMIDVLISFQLGLPSMFRSITSDTQPPRNLLDRDFGTNTAVLPQSRGVEELTPSSYTRAKLRITRVFADAAEISHQTVPPSYEEIMRLDRALEEAKAAIPPLLQMPDISELVTDPAEQLMCRFNLDLLYMKTKIVLHRRYMLTPMDQLTQAEQQLGIGTSRKACIECALRVLGHHHTIYSASQTGGQLESVKWYMGSISTHDFLLAAMVLCLELSEQIHNRSFSYSPLGMQCPRRRAMMDALEKSHRIWSDASGRKKKHMQLTTADGMEKGEHLFDETEKASRAMAVMLEKVKRQMAETPQPSSTEPSTSTSQMEVLDVPSVPGYVYTDTQQLQETGFNGLVSQHAWGNLNDVPLPDGLDTSSGQPLNWTPADTGSSGVADPYSFIRSTNDTADQSFNAADYSMIGDMLDGPMNLDWEMWDNEIIKGPQQGMDEWTDLDVTGGIPGYNNRAMGSEAAMVSGNVYMPGGTGTLGGSSGAMGLNLDMMNDVDFSMAQGNEYPLTVANGYNAG